MHEIINYYYSKHSKTREKRGNEGELTEKFSLLCVCIVFISLVGNQSVEV